MQAVMQIGSDAAGIISKSTEIEFIEAIKADGDVFKNMAQFCNTEMSKAVLGQTLSSDIGDAGSYAASKTHAEVRQDILESDCKGALVSLGMGVAGVVLSAASLGSGPVGWVSGLSYGLSLAGTSFSGIQTIGSCF